MALEDSCQLRNLEILADAPHLLSSETCCIFLIVLNIYFITENSYNTALDINYVLLDILSYQNRLRSCLTMLVHGIPLDES